MGLMATTGYGQKEDRFNALAVGFVFHLIKPIGCTRLCPLAWRRMSSLIFLH